LEGICQEGEILHVPSGWWHLAVNLETTMAVTQNFVPRKHLSSALDFLKYKADQVSGFKKEVERPYDLFIQRMEESFPGVLEAGMTELEAKRKRKWEEVVKEDGVDKTSEAGGFSFGFGEDSSDIEVP
jgi:ribosomal protein L16 Arg81 hydroxylase